MTFAAGPALLHADGGRSVGHLPLGVGVARVGPSRAVTEAAHLGRGQAEVVRVEDVVDAAQSQVRDPDDPTVAVAVVVGPEPVADGVPDANLELDERRGRVAI